MLKKITAVLAFFLACKAALAVEYFGIDNTISGNAVDVQINIIAEEVEFKFFGDIKNFTSNADCTVAENLIRCKQLNATTISLKFRSSSILQTDGNTYKFFQQFLLPYTRRVTSLLTLPVGTIVANVSDAVYPQKYSTLSNGRNILVYWELTNISSLQPLAFQVYFQPIETGKKETYPTPYILLVFIVVVIVVAGLSFRRSRAKVMVKPEKVVLKVLDGYERKVFEVVKKAGSIKQGKIVEATGISKAKVSRVVKSLESKGLVKSERRGRTKIVSLKKKIF